MTIYPEVEILLYCKNCGEELHAEAKNGEIIYVHACPVCTSK